jgi:PhzF family phenazine biosynthesis protein
MSNPVLRYAAFSHGGRGGNPAGVVIGAGSLDPREMLRIAHRVGYSETAFVGPPAADHVRELRFFSPLAEVAFCGHATIATAVALRDHGATDPLRFDTPAGLIEVATTSTEGGTLATLESPPASTRPATDAEITRALGALRWASTDLDPALPPHVAFAGNHHLVLAGRRRERHADLHYDFDDLAALMAELDWTTVDLVWRESSQLFHARNPFPPGGVVEDPATGAAAAAFGGYLRELELVDLRQPVTILQGVDMGSPSRLIVDLHPESDRVSVSGLATRLADPADPV